LESFMHATALNTLTSMDSTLLAAQMETVNSKAGSRRHILPYSAVPEPDESGNGSQARCL